MRWGEPGAAGNFKAGGSHADVQEFTVPLVSEDLDSTATHLCTPLGLVILFLGVYANKTLLCVLGWSWSHFHSKELETINAPMGTWGRNYNTVSYIVGHYAAEKKNEGGLSTYTSHINLQNVVLKIKSTGNLVMRTCHRLKQVHHSAGDGAGGGCACAGAGGTRGICTSLSTLLWT